MTRPLLRTVPLPEKLTSGRIHLTSMPGRYGPLAAFLDEVSKAKVTEILCLVSDEEIAEKSPAYLALIKSNGIPAFMTRYDIPDFGVPKEHDKLRDTLGEIQMKLHGGESVVIHCAGGRGRTGMVTTLLLMEMGLTLDHAADLVEVAGSAPDTEEQRRFIRQWKSGLPED